MANGRKRRPDAEATSLRLPPLRIALIVVGALALSWFAFVVSVAGVARVRNPDLAASIAPYDAVAAGERAYARVEAGLDPESIADAKRLATGALVRDPTVVAAARTLGLVAAAEGQAAQAGRLFRYSETLSRRDFATQLWLIEQRVAADDAAGALGHFDKALRTSKLAPPVLIPILVSATEDARLVRPLGDMLATRPPWRPLFYRAAIDTGKALPNLTALLARTGGHADLRQMAARLASEGRPDLAARLYAAGGGKLGGGVSGWRGAGDFLPFDWELINSGPTASDLIDDGGRQALEFSVNGGERADIVRKLLSLKPGAYRLAFQSTLDTDAPALPRWTIACAQTPELLADVPVAAPRRIVHDFEVPASGCAYQWLRFVMPNNRAEDVIGGRVTAIAVAPR